MAVNPRFEIGPCSPDGIPFGYSNTHRSHFSGGPNLERGSSFRDSHDGRSGIQGVVGASFPGSSSSGHGELQPLSQVLSLDLVSSGEQKYARQLELRRAIIAAVGISSEEQMHGTLQSRPLEQQGQEELKRIKASLSDNAARARERSRGLAEAISKLDKYRAISQTRKRVRSEVHERPITILSVERPATAGTSMKGSFCASPSHSNIADSGTPKPEDKNKGVVPNKRVRTSMVDVRLEGRTNTSSFQRSLTMTERDRESFKSSGSLAACGEEKDRIVTTSGEGWEKSKMKGRRSGTKSDAVITTAANGISEVEREHKWGAQHRISAENRSRPSEGHGFRSGPVHGVMSMHKVESVQQNGTAMRSINRSESADGPSSVGEKGDRSILPEKERPHLKNGVKLSHREDGPLLSPTTVTKAKAARAPRSSTAVSVNPSAHLSRPLSSTDVWERAPSRAHLPVGPSNRKRPAPSRSSSPPVAQWVGQRPQKMARIARRMNRVPPVGPPVSRDEAVSMGEGTSAREGSTTMVARANPSMSPAGGFPRRLASTATLSQTKPKVERVTPSTGISDSDDSETGVIKSKEKGKKHGDSEGRIAPVSQKMGPLVLPGKKSRTGSKEESGDGVRRQGRSSRGLIAVRESSVVTQVEKMDASVNAKQLRSARPGVEKLEKSVEIKPGRPPTKKGTGDRKPLTRPRRPAGNGTGDASGESDDDREELMASVKAAVNASAASCPSNFWREMEPFFAYLTPDERENLRKQVRELVEVEISLSLCSSDEKGEKAEVLVATPPESPVASLGGKVACLANGSMDVDGGVVSKVFNNLKDKEAAGIGGRTGLNGSWTDKGIPLSQRLLAALIIEGDSEDGSWEDGSQNELQTYARDGSSHDLTDTEQAELDKRDQESEFEAETRRKDSRKLNGWVKGLSYDDLSVSNGHRHVDAATLLQKVAQPDVEDIVFNAEPDLANCSAIVETKKEKQKQFSSYKSKEDQLFGSVCGLPSWDIRYKSLTLDDRIVLELQSIGLCPDLSELATREDDEIAAELKRSQIELKDQIHSNKERLTCLESTVSNSRSTEEKERERLAMFKLVEVAFSRRVGCRGGVLGASGSKCSTSKDARAAALAFAKRTLSRWKQLETGQSCFTDAGLRDILFCVSSKEGEARGLTNIGETWVINSGGPCSLGSSDLKSSGNGQFHMPGVEKPDKESSESGQVAAMSSDPMGEKYDVWSSRPKEREVLLEDVGSGGIGNVVLGGIKGKRSERERDGKNQCKDIAGRTDSNKGGRQALGTIKGERKTKTKPRQKTAPLLKAVGLLGKPQELGKESTPTLSISSEKSADRFMKAKEEPMSLEIGIVQEAQPEPEATLDLCHLPIPSMDDFVGNGDLGGQGPDLTSWLDFEDPGLPDAGGDIMGLDVPMDDLADLAMMM